MIRMAKTSKPDHAKTMVFLILGMFMGMLLVALAVAAYADYSPAYWFGIVVGASIMCSLFATNTIQLPQSQMQNVTTTQPTTTIHAVTYNAPLEVTVSSYPGLVWAIKCYTAFANNTTLTLQRCYGDFVGASNFTMTMQLRNQT